MTLAHALFVLSAAAALTAQTTCPHKQAHHVDAAWSFGPTVNCGGVEIVTAGGSYHTSAQGCPLQAVFVPPHDTEEPTSSATQVEVIGQVPMEIFSYNCEGRYFLIFKVGSDCVSSGNRVGATLPLLRTIGCAVNTAD